MNLSILNSDAPILITGPTGSGKTIKAKKFHEDSKRKHAPFIHVNVAAITDDFFCSELFGHEKGSFTGAIGQREGYCSQAGEGTLFLDEIGELSKSKQAALLTLIEQRMYFRLGGVMPIAFKGKFIFATNKNLENLVREGEFREDLYYRIRFFHQELKALKDSSKNILSEIIKVINQKKIQYSRFNFTLSQEALNCFATYSWPGNYRELNQTLDYLFFLDRDKVELGDLPDWLLNESEENKDYSHKSCFKYALESFERQYLETHLQKNEGKINQTALSTGINKVTLISKLKKYDIDRKKYKQYQSA